MSNMFIFNNCIELCFASTISLVNEDHSLDFFCWSKRWQGATATVVEDNTTSVWGALWVLDKKHMKSLDNQEAVHKGIYKVYQIKVEMPNGTTADCRSYQLSNQPLKLEEGESWPEERKPSLIYLNTIIAGAKESGLPLEYIQQLEAIPHNGYNEPISPDDNNFSCGENEECDEGDSTNDVDNSQPHCTLWLLLVIIYFSLLPLLVKCYKFVMLQSETERRLVH